MRTDCNCNVPTVLSGYDDPFYRCTDPTVQPHRNTLANIHLLGWRTASFVLCLWV